MQPLPVRNEAPHEETGKLSARGNGQRQDANINHTHRHVPSTTKHNSGRQTVIHRQQAVARTAYGAAIAGAGDLLSAILRYMTNIVMTHIVSPSVYGTFIVAYTVVTVIGYTAKFGLDSAMLRFPSASRANNRRAWPLGLVRCPSCLMLL